MSKHEFAFYTTLVSTMVREPLIETYELTDPVLIYRIATILRIEKGETIVLFDALFHVKATIIHIDNKRSIRLALKEVEKNKQLTPAIHWVLPILKREAFEQAIYSLQELGATTIQPILTNKSARVLTHEKETTRLPKIIIAAAEQSKHYVLASLLPIIPFDLWLLKSHSPTTVKVFFDASGIPLSSFIEQVKSKEITDIIALSGPEGDLTHEEKQMLIDQGFIFCALTPTILRAQQALSVGLGALRSLF